MNKSQTGSRYTGSPIGNHRLSRRHVLHGGMTATAAGLATLAMPAGPADAHKSTTRSTIQQRDDSERSTVPYLEVAPGVRLFVQDWGEGKTILLVHGWPSSHLIFEFQTLALAQRGYRVVAIDLRGFGQSDKPWDGNDYDTWAADIGAVLAALNLRNVTLAGYSMGGAVAMHYVATNQDERVTKLALLAAAGPRLVAGPDNPHGLPPEVFAGIIQGIGADRPGFFSAYVPNLFANPVNPAYRRWFEAIVLSASPYATLRGVDEGGDRDLRRELEAIRVPTRIFHGIKDQVVPFEFAKEQQRLIRGATLVPFEQSGHGLFVDDKDKLVDELSKFLG
jgi:non-heme chloroperoxidase